MCTANCARCGLDFAGGEGFVTCPVCRIPDKPAKPRKAPRQASTRKNATSHWEESGTSFDNVVRALEEDR